MYRIIIADDEKNIREGLKRFIEKNCPDFTVAASAENGKQALEYSRALIPDVVITDINMPKVNGLEYLEMIKEVLPDTILLVISGYETFDYAVQCIRLGVREYFLKPIDTKRLLQVLEQARQELDSSRRRWKGEGEEHVLRPALQEERLKKIILGRQTGVLIPEKIYYAVYSYGEMNSQLLYQKLQIGFGDQAQVYAVSQEEIENLFVFECAGKDAGQCFTKLRKGMTSIYNYCRISGGWNIHFLISRPGKNAGELDEVCQELKKLQKCVFWDIAEPVLSCAEVLAGRTSGCAAAPDRMIREIRIGVQSRNYKEIKKSCSELKEWFLSHSPIDANFVKTLIIVIVSQIVFDKEENFSPEIYHLFSKFKEDAGNTVRFADLMGILEEFLIQFAECSRYSMEKGRKLSQKIERMIEEEMGNSDLNVESIAGKLYLSPNYLRTLFKKETGMTFVEYLTRKRMERAKLLLRSREIKISEVAELVGYNDSKYFSNQFKRYQGVSPAEYQNTKSER